VDFSMPERFDLTYEGGDGKKHRPIMIHRAILGSLERFIGILLEHYAGKLPVWLSPVQVKIINVAEPHLQYCRDLEKTLMENNIRLETDFRNETLGYKIREARNARVPFSIVIGDKEVSENLVAVRNRENKTETMTVNEFIQRIKECNQKRI